MNSNSDKSQGVQGYAKIALRRRRSMLLAFGIGLGGILDAGIPAARALSLFGYGADRTAGNAHRHGQVDQDVPTADQRVQVISKRVMTTATLLDIIKRYNLYPREAACDTRECSLLKKMREDIRAEDDQCGCD